MVTARQELGTLAAVIAWPIDGPQIAGLALGGSRRLQPDPAIPRGPRIIGEATFPGAEKRES